MIAIIIYYVLIIIIIINVFIINYLHNTHGIELVMHTYYRLYGSPKLYHVAVATLCFVTKKER